MKSMQKTRNSSTRLIGLALAAVIGLTFAACKTDPESDAITEPICTEPIKITVEVQ